MFVIDGAEESYAELADWLVDAALRMEFGLVLIVPDKQNSCWLRLDTKTFSRLSRTRKFSITMGSG